MAERRRSASASLQHGGLVGLVAVLAGAMCLVHGVPVAGAVLVVLGGLWWVAVAFTRRR